MNIEINVTHTLSPDVMDLIAKALNGNAESSPKKVKKIETKLVEVTKPVQEDIPASKETPDKEIPEELKPRETLPEPVKEEAAAKGAKRITLEEVSSKALTLANGGKRREVKDLLKEFKTEKVSLLKEEQFSDFLTALNQI